MFIYLVKRIYQSVIVMVAVALVSFLLFAFVGDPVSSMVGQDTTLEEREAIRQALGLNDPFYMQFLTFIGNAVQGDFGQSWFWKKPVAELIGSRLPATLELVLVSAIMAMTLGVLICGTRGLFANAFANRTGRADKGRAGVLYGSKVGIVGVSNALRFDGT